MNKSNQANTLSDLINKSIHDPTKPIKLHLGCGEVYMQGYINIDFPPTEHPLQKLSKADYFADITSISFPEESVDEIRLHHVFEHFDRVIALGLISEWHLWLKIGGKLRIETPDIYECSKSLLHAKSYIDKQKIIRHMFGSHEASWAYHLDGWYDKKFIKVFSRLGFNVTIRKSKWDKEPYLPNIEMVCTKKMNLTNKVIGEICTKILHDSLVDDSIVENELLNIWEQRYISFISEKYNTKSQNSSQIPIFPESDLFSDEGYNNTDFEKNGELLIIKSLFKKPKIIFDVGANRGQWSKLALKENDNHIIHLFEPLIANFDALTKNFASNNQAFLNNCAVSNLNGYKKFYFYDSSPSLAELSSFYKRRKVIKIAGSRPLDTTVTTCTLDSYCSEKQVDHLDFLKIDVEGAEFEVLLGARNLISNNRINFIQFEYGGTYIDSGYRLKGIVNYLLGFNYLIYRIFNKGIIQIDSWKIELENFKYSNYLAINTIPSLNNIIKT